MSVMKTFARGKQSSRDIITNKNVVDRKISPIGQTSVCIKVNSGRYIHESKVRKKE